MSETATVEQPVDLPYSQVRAPGAGILGNHPMRERIVKAILEGKQTTREIAAWSEPKVTHVTIARLAQHVKAELAAATALHKAKQIQSVAEIIGANKMSPEKVTELAIGGNHHLARIRQHQIRIDARLEKLGDDSDVNDLSTLIKTDLQGVRLAAEIDGSLVSTPVNQSLTTNILVLPTNGPADPEHQVIDTTAEPA